MYQLILYQIIRNLIEHYFLRVYTQFCSIFIDLKFFCYAHLPQNGIFREIRCVFKGFWQ